MRARSAALDRTGAVRVAETAAALDVTAEPPQSAKQPDEIDIHVGERARFIRTSRSLSHDDVARALGISIGQLHKYERGQNRFSAGRLYALSTVLRVPVAWFFEGLDGHPAASPVPPESETGQLLRAFETIPDPDVKRAILDFALIASRVYTRLLRHTRA